MTLHLVAFGPPVLTRGGGPVPPELAWRKHFALLVYLARSPGGSRRREHLVGLLWPDKDEAKARHSLNEACRAIRRGAGDDALATQADTITLRAGCLTTDWQTAEAALEAGDPARVAELWRGDFMEGFGIPDATPFEDWLAAERLHWRVRFRDALTAEAERLVREGDVVRGLALAARVLVFDPAAEAALRVAMTAEALAGAAPAALERFAGYIGWLERELGAEPAVDLAQLAGRIRAGARAGRPEASGDEPPPPPLVGRGRWLAAAARYLPRPGGEASVVLVTGEPGLGRSRLVREIAMRAGLAGAVVTTTVCVTADADLPGTVLGDLLRRGLVDAAGFGAAPGEALTALAALEPSVATRYPGVAAAGRRGGGGASRWGEHSARPRRQWPRRRPCSSRSMTPTWPTTRHWKRCPLCGARPHVPRSPCFSARDPDPTCRPPCRSCGRESGTTWRAWSWPPIRSTIARWMRWPRHSSPGTTPSSGSGWCAGCARRRPACRCSWWRFCGRWLPGA